MLLVALRGGRGRCRGTAARRTPAMALRQPALVEQPVRPRERGAVRRVKMRARAAASTSASRRARRARGRPAGSRRAPRSCGRAAAAPGARRARRDSSSRASRSPSGRGLREQLVLRVEERGGRARGVGSLRDRRCGSASRPAPGGRRAPGQQLLLAAHVAVDRARAHPGALGDRAQRRAVEAALAEQRARRLANPSPAAPPAQQASVVVAQRGGSGPAGSAAGSASRRTRSHISGWHGQQPALPGAISEPAKQRRPGWSAARQPGLRTPEAPSQVGPGVPTSRHGDQRALAGVSNDGFIRNIRAGPGRPHKSLIPLESPGGERMTMESLFLAWGSGLPEGKASPDSPGPMLLRGPEVLSTTPGRSA